MANRRTNREKKQGLFFLLLTVVLILLLIFVAFPLFIKLAVYLGNLKANTSVVDQPEQQLLLPPKLDSLPTATNSAYLKVSGRATSDSTVELLVNGIKRDSTDPDAQGKFEFFDVYLPEEKNRLQARSVFSEEKQVISDSIEITVDKVEPEIVVESPEDGTTIYQDQQLNNEITVSGSVNEELNLYVNDHYAQLDRELKFSSVVELAEGENQIKLRAVDSAGNSSTEELTIFFR